MYVFLILINLLAAIVHTLLWDKMEENLLVATHLPIVHSAAIRMLTRWSLRGN